MIGSSAAALIGLMFVVVTLTAGRDRKDLEPGKKLYTTPIVWHLGVVLVLSGLAEMPVMNERLFGLASGVAALIGLVMGLRISLGIAQAQLATSYTGYDACWYGIAPALIYAALGVSATGLILNHDWALVSAAIAIMALLVVSIHNEWDLVTFLAPTAQTLGSNPDENSSK